VKRAFTVGLLVVVGCFLAATVWMMGSMLADGVAVVRSFDERCTEPSDVVFPGGSCAPPLRAEDFAAGRATITLTVVRTDSARG
jgi:hypothetical protein